jgi:hypothetical protein
LMIHGPAPILVLLLWLGLIVGCTSTRRQDSTITKNSTSASRAPSAIGRCEPFEKFVQTPDGGALVSGVDIKRDGNGNITTQWKTTFAAGTQANIDLLLWKPNKRESPGLDESGTDMTLCDGTVIRNINPFSNGGKGYNQGRYYAYLSFFDDDSNWKQPKETQIALAAAKGKVKAVSQYAPGGRALFFEAFAPFELPSCTDLQATTAPTPRPTMTKEEIEGIARKIYARTLENKMSQRGTPVKVTVSGENNTTITIESLNFTRESVMLQAANEEYVAPFRKAHFKRLEFTDGTSTWGIDLN